MKILQINNYFYKCGGIETLYFNTIDLLRRYGHDVIPFSSIDKNSYESEFEIYFVKEKEIRNSFDKIFHCWGRFYSKEAKQNIKKLLKIFKPDIAHIHNINGRITFSILPVLREFNIPIVASIHGFKYLCPVWEFYRKGKVCEKCMEGKYFYCLINNCSAHGLGRSFLLTLDSYLRDYFYPHYKYFDAYIFVSQFTMKKFIEAIPQIAGKSYQLYNFVYCDNFVFNIPQEKYFLFFGRLEQSKGLINLLETFEKIPEHKLVIVGEGSLKQFILNYKLSNVELLGYKSGNELDELIKNSFFVVVPSLSYENNPMTILEAYSYGKPVIASEVGGILEIVEEGKTGFLFQRNNSEQLRNIIYKCNQLDNATYLYMSNSAYQLAKNKFNPESYYQKLITIYMKVLREKKL